jgi:hypothetical protein
MKLFFISPLRLFAGGRLLLFTDKLLIVALRLFFPPYYIQLADRQGYVNKLYLPTERMMQEIEQHGYLQWNDYIIGTLQPDYSTALWQSVSIAVVTLVIFIVIKRWFTSRSPAHL